MWYLVSRRPNLPLVLVVLLVHCLKINTLTFLLTKCQLRWCVASERALLWSHPDVGGLEVPEKDVWLHCRHVRK